MPPHNGVTLFQFAETYYHQGNSDKAFEYYQLGIKKILKDENPTAKIPAIVPDDAPEETLSFLWRNLVGFFRDPQMNYTQETAPEAYKLLVSFRPSAPKPHKDQVRFKTPEAQILLKGMQITAGMTLGLLAWDKKDRATAAKRYKEALDLAATYEPFNRILPTNKHLLLWVSTDVQQTKDNLNTLMRNDVANAQILKDVVGIDGGHSRKDAVPLGNVRVEGSGVVNIENQVMMASDECLNCGIRGVKLLRCGKCKKAAYCDSVCQKANWRVHKKSCTATALA